VKEAAMTPSRGENPHEPLSRRQFLTLGLESEEPAPEGGYPRAARRRHIAWGLVAVALLAAPVAIFFDPAATVVYSGLLLATLTTSLLIWNGRWGAALLLLAATFLLYLWSFVKL
jgi:hypothetical protein